MDFPMRIQIQKDPKVICILFTLFSLLEYFLVIRCYSTLRNTHLTTVHRQQRPPSAQQNYEDGKETATVIVTQDEPLITSLEGSHRHKRSNHLDLVSRIAFPLLFLLAIVVFVLFNTF